MSDTNERLSDVVVTDTALIGYEDVSLEDVQSLAREAQDFRRLAALCAEHGGIERVVAMGLAVAAQAAGPWANYIRTADGRMVIAMTLPGT